MRIPSPVLFLAAVHALLGRPAAESPRRLTRYRPPLATDIGAQLAFLHDTGYWSHYDALLRASAWPLHRVTDLHALVDVAERLGVLRPEPVASDLYVRAGGADSWVEAGVIVAVADTIPWPGAPQFLCLTAHARVGPDGGRVIGTREEWFAPLNGDRFVAWADVDGVMSYRRAA